MARGMRWSAQPARYAVQGSVLLMVIFGVALSLAVILGAVSAASLYLERKNLYLLADGAALAASQSFALSSVTVNSSTHELAYRLTDADVWAASRRYLAELSTSRSVKLVSATCPDGQTAVVRLDTVWQPPVVSMFLPQGIRIFATARARGGFR